MIQLRVIGLLIVVAVAALGWVATCGAWHFDRVAAGVLPLDARSFGQLTLITAGTGGAYENPARRGPATAVAFGSQIALVDAGRGVAESLRFAKIPVSQVDRVFLTNLLPENTVGLDDLLLTGWLNGRSEPLLLVGPPGTAELAAGLEAGHARGRAARAAELELPPDAAHFRALEVSDSWSDERDGLSVRAEPLPGGPLEALAYRFDAKQRSAVVSGTGWGEEVLVALARGADVLVHEAASVPTPELAAQLGLDADPAQLLRDAQYHTRLEDVGRLASEAGVSALVLVRLRPPPVLDMQLTSIVDDTFDGRIVVPEDGEELLP